MKLLPGCRRKLEALEARIEEIRSSISPDQGNADQQDMATIIAINSELDTIRTKKSDLRQTMSDLSLEEFGLSKVLDYLESADFTYDDSALLPILDKVLVLENGFEINFIIGKKYKV